MECCHAGLSDNISSTKTVPMNVQSPVKLLPRSFACFEEVTEGRELPDQEAYQAPPLQRQRFIQVTPTAAVAL